MDLESSNLEISSERLDLAEKDLRTVGFHIVENVISQKDGKKKEKLEAQLSTFAFQTYIWVAWNCQSSISTNF